ncbi:hypothetical protein GGX14DRAFT_598072 [Mycena pura]|uniref:Uncharacterized protein n=1 Tax=Mycena pura TaxID=153505 RepID=A0AAD6YEX9_9AGAR|nr:hypothetical protein GGX14DRAFT_598072 [Mycena pura]
MLALENNIDAWGSLSRTSEYFARHPIKKEADVTSVGTVIFTQLQTILRGGFNLQLKKEEQPSLVDPRPDRFLSVADIRRLVWEDKSWKVFEAHAPEILKLAKSAEGRSLTFRGAEEHGRAILYKLSVTMFDTNCHWSLLFGGNSSLIIQRVPSTDPTRYGLICSDLTSLSDLFLVVLVSTAFSSSYLESPPDSPPPCTPPHLTTFAINYFEKEKKPTVQSSPPRAVVPMLNVTEYITPGATGLVFRATLGSMPLVIKAIPPGWEGGDDLFNEAVVYEALASLQGIALPRSAGLFEGHGWLIIILEDVGRPVTAGKALAAGVLDSRKWCTPP